MTTEAGSQAHDAQQVINQVIALIGVVKPLADRLKAAGTMEGAVAEGKKIAVEAIRSGAVGASLGAAMGPPGAPATKAQGSTSDTAAPREGPKAGDVIPPANLSGVASLIGAGARAANPTMMYVQAGLHGIQMLTDFLRDYTEVVETEKTKRVAITAERDKRVVELEAIRSTMQLYLEKTFDERRDNFNRMFDALDQAQASGDLHGMQLMLGGILDLAKSNPFKDLDTFKRSLADPTFVLEL